MFSRKTNVLVSLVFSENTMAIHLTLKHSVNHYNVNQFGRISFFYKKNKSWRIAFDHYLNELPQDLFGQKLPTKDSRTKLSFDFTRENAAK